MSIVSIDAALLRDVGTRTLQTKRLTLRPFRYADAQAMYENWACKRAVTEYVTWQPHQRVEETEALLDHWVSLYDNPHTYRWAIERQSDQRLIGSIDVVRFDSALSAAEMGYCSDPSTWGQGLMTEAFVAVIDYLFNTVRIRRIHARHDIRNPASGRVMAKAGMRFEGVLSASFADKDGYLRDMAHYVILREDYKKTYKEMTMSNIISGKELSKTIRQEVKEDVAKLLEQTGRVPHLVVILVGDDPASLSYVTAKEKACVKAGMKSTLLRKDESITEEALLALIQSLNDDPDVHGILVQLPLPNHIDENLVIETIKQEKDVDGFHPLNVAAVHLGLPGILPATPKGIMTMLHSTNTEIKGKNALVIGRSNIVGKPVAMLLLKEHATVTIAHSRTVNLKELALQADILVAAVGRANMVTPDMIKEGAILIDVGVNRVDGKLVGDIDFEGAKEKASFITPVPGGVGPMTIASLLQNTVECFKMIETK